MSTNNPMSNIPPLGPPTGMMPGGSQSKFKPIDPLRVLRANWLWIVFTVVIGTGIGVGVWIGLNRTFPQYTSMAQFDVQASNVDIATGRSTGPVRMTELEPLILREVQVIMAEPILRSILNKPAVQQTKWFAQFNNNMDKALEELTENVLRANHVRDTPLFIARASTPNQDDAQIILTALCEEYKGIKRDKVDREQIRDMDAATRRRNAAEEKITAIRAAIKRFLTNTPLETLAENTSEAALQVQRLVFEKNELDKSYNSLEATYAQLQKRQEEGNFDPSDEERQMIEMGQEIIGIDSQRRQLRVARAAQLAKFGPNHEVIKQIDEQLLALDREREKEFQEQARILFAAKLENAALGQQILKDELNKATTALAEWTIKRQENVRLLQEYETLERELEYAEVEKDLSEKQIADLIEADIREARVVVEESMSPQQAKQTFPPEPYITIPGVAFMITLMVTGLIFLRELLDQRVRSAADVKMIPDASLVGTIPSADQDRSGGAVERVVEGQPSGLLAEAFRQVRTAVLSKMDRRGYKTLMVVSAKPSAGVTSIAQNLGASCALSGRRVLLIDANFRRPGLANLMDLPGGSGLADLLCGDEDLDRALDLVTQTKTQGLSVLSTGNSEKAAVELFENPRFRELLARLESEYDLLIFDAPPALLTSDAQLLSRHIDAMVLVSRARTDTRGMLQRLYRELDGQRADILGIVLNGVQASAGGYLKRNYKEFHDYSGPDRRKSDRSGDKGKKARTAAVVPAEVNGTGSHEDAPAPMPLDLNNPSDDDDDILGGFDLSGEEDENK